MAPCEFLPEHCHEFPENVLSSSEDKVRIFMYALPKYPEFSRYQLPDSGDKLRFGGVIGYPLEVWVRTNEGDTRWSNVKDECLPNPETQCPGENSATSQPNWYDTTFDSEGYGSLWTADSIEIALGNFSIDELISSFNEEGRNVSVRLTPLEDRGLRADDIVLPHSRPEIRPPVPGTTGAENNCAGVDRSQIFPYEYGGGSNVRLYGDLFIAGPSGNPVFDFSGQDIRMCSDHPAGEWDLTLRVYDGNQLQRTPLRTRDF